MAREVMIKSSELSDCEKRILGCIYEYHRKQQEAPNLKDIMQLLEIRYGIEWKMQTICTFFTRMEKKGLLTIKKRGRYSYYYPVLPFEVYVQQEIESFYKIYFEGDKRSFKRFVRQL